VDRAVAGLGGAGPTLLGFRCDYGDGVTGGEQRGDKFVEKGRGNAVVVGDEKIHGVEVTTKFMKDTKKEFTPSGRIEVMAQKKAATLWASRLGAAEAEAR
jgi:hypothetical protein